MKYEVVYTLRKTIEAENIFDADNIAKEQTPEGMELLDFDELIEE